MKVLTAAEMRDVDARTIELGIPGLVLMENAGARVVEFLAERFAPLAAERVVVLCGKGNNGGDGLVIARQLYTRGLAAELTVVLLARPEELAGDAAANWRMLSATGCPVEFAIPVAKAARATLVVDALLGTGISGAARGAMADAIASINREFPLARVVAVDLPSGMASDTGESAGDVARSDATVTFTAPKVAHAMPPNCDRVGEMRVAVIGSPAHLFEHVQLELVESSSFASLFVPRPRGGHKGTFGHALIVAGSRGKTGAAALAGLGALRAGAGLVTVATAESAAPVVASYAAELMTEALPETEAGAVSLAAFDYGRLPSIAASKTVIAIGPGLGRHADAAALVERACAEFAQPIVLDADALVDGISGSKERLRVITPHPGEMARLNGSTTEAVQRDRIGVARRFACERGVVVVLKGQRTLIAWPDGRVMINPTGTPALGTAGSGDVLTGLLAGLLAQFPDQPERAIPAAVYLAGRAGELGARVLGEKSLIARDVLTYLPAAMEECVQLPHRD